MTSSSLESSKALKGNIKIRRPPTLFFKFNHFSPFSSSFSVLSEGGKETIKGNSKPSDVSKMKKFSRSFPTHQQRSRQNCFLMKFSKSKWLKHFFYLYSPLPSPILKTEASVLSCVHAHVQSSALMILQLIATRQMQGEGWNSGTERGNDLPKAMQQGSDSSDFQ